jgi:uncharacterized membrane protein YeaQ/YmgE (transglycosylase-associated protein family)
LTQAASGDRITAVVLLIGVLALILLLVLGWLIVGLALKLIWWALLGLLIGALARLVLPGQQRIGLLWTMGAGIAAALLGGIVAHALDLGGFLQFVVAVALAAGLVALLSGSERLAAS